MMNLKTMTLLGALALGASAMAQLSTVDGVRGSEWNGIQAYHISHSDTAPTDGSISPFNAGASYDALLRSDSSYLYALVIGTGDFASSAGTFANLYFNTDNYQSTGGSSLGFEVTNHDAFIPTNNPVTVNIPASNDFKFAKVDDAANGNIAVEFAVSWNFLENDPLGIGFAKSKPGDLVTFRTSQSFGYTFSGYDAADPNGYVAPGPSGYPDRLGHVYAPQAVPEPASMAALGLGGLGLLRRRTKR